MELEELLQTYSGCPESPDRSQSESFQSDSSSDKVNKFLDYLHERSSTPLHHNLTDNDIWVFWSKNEGSENNSFSDDDLGTPINLIHDKIRSIFFNIMIPQLGFLAQWWAPVTMGGRRLLSTSGQPFAVSELSEELARYRVYSEKYKYDIDVNNMEDDQMIKTDGPATAFLNRFPICHLERESRSRLDFRGMLPIRFPSQSDCIGVLEITLTYKGYFVKEVQKAVQEAGLDVCKLQEHIPYKTINGLGHVKDEIEQALKVVCKSHKISLAQVWIPFEDKSHVPLPSYSEVTRRLFGLKLTGYCNYDQFFHDDTLDAEYCAKIGYWEELRDVFPLGNRKEHTLKTLQDFKPRYIFELDDLLAYRDAPRDKLCAFAICLRSIDTGDFSFAFQFIWPKQSRCDIFLEAILLTIKRCLPSFKFASGVELGDELDVIEVGCFKEGQTNNFKLFQGKRLSPILKVTCNTTSNVLCANDTEKQLDVICANKPMERTMVKAKTAEIILTLEVIEKHYDKPMKDAAKLLNVSVSTLKRKLRKLGIPEWPKREKRKRSDLTINQIDTNEEDNGATHKPSTIAIKAEYEGFMIKISHLNSQATFETVEKKIGMKLKLSLGTYKLTYLDEDEDWILLKSDEDVSDCIKSSRKSDRIVVRVRVLPSTSIQI